MPAPKLPPPPHRPSGTGPSRVEGSTARAASLGTAASLRARGAPLRVGAPGAPLRTPGAVAVLILLLLGTVGCWPWRDGSAVWDRTRAQGVGLEVRNQNFSDVVIYLIPNGQRRRIGEVTGHTSGSFDLTSHPEVLSRSFRLSVEPIGSRDRYLSGPISVHRGSQVVLTVTGQLRQSHWHIR